MFEPTVKRCVGLDVHKMVVVATALVEEEDGSIKEETKQFGTFRRHRCQLVRWLKRLDVELPSLPMMIGQLPPAKLNYEEGRRGDVERWKSW